MKKKLLLSVVLLIAGLSVNAQDWQYIKTDIPNLNMSIDKDTIKKINDNEYLYAIKYQVDRKPEKVAYIKANLKTNQVGIINSNDFDILDYNPYKIFANPHAFMKNVEDGSLLSYSQKYISDSIYGTGPNVKNVDEIVAEVRPLFKAPQPEETVLPEYHPVKPVNSDIPNYQLVQRVSSATDIKEYVAETAEQLNSNWQPPKSGKKTQTIVILQIGADGSLQNYKFAKSSGDKMTDRSIISAAEKVVPYAKYMKSDSSYMNLQFVFEYKNFKKSVI